MLSLETAHAYMCEGTFDRSDRHLVRVVNYEEFVSKIHGQMAPTEDATHLGITWSMPFPALNRRTPEGGYLLDWDGKHFRNYIGRPDDPQTPLPFISNIVQAPKVNARDFYEKVYANYDGKVREELIQQLHAVDESLEYDRISYGLIFDFYGRQTSGDQRHFGTVRMYDASERPWGLHYLDSGTDGGPIVEGGTKLPYQRLNELRNIPRLKVDDYLDRQKKLGRKVIEISKFSIEANASISRRVRAVIELIWMRAIMQMYPDAIFIAHVVAEKHMRHYHGRYGLEVAEKFDAPGNPEQEAIMWIEGWRLVEKLRELTAMKDLSVSYPESKRWRLPKPSEL